MIISFVEYFAEVIADYHVPLGRMINTMACTPANNPYFQYFLQVL